MFLTLLECDEKLYQEAKTFFLQQWRSDLLAKTKVSLIWAYKITQYMLQHWKPDFSFINGKYAYEDLFFSTSHSKDDILIVIDTKKVAVDLEYIIPRDSSLLIWMHKINDKFSERENFYIQRCCKECLIKYLDLNAEDMKWMEIKSCEKSEVILDNFQFKYVLNLKYWGSSYQIHFDLNWNKIMAIL